MSQPTLNDLKAFAAVATHRSFRRAATELDLSPSSLSHTVRTLESTLGVRLLNRTTRSVSPTEAGERLLARLAPVLQDLELALAEVDVFRTAPAGTVRINAPEGAAAMLVKHVIPVMRTRFQDVAIDLVTEDRLVDIVAERFDAGVRLGESVPQDMVGIRFGGEARFIAVAAPSYIETAGVPRTPDDLHHHACIRYRLPSGKIYRWEFEKQSQQIAIDVPGALTLDHMALMLEAASQGLGIAFVLERIARPHLDSGQLQIVLGDWSPEFPGLFLYYPGRRQVPAALRAFIDTLKEVLP